jgi:ribosomal protein S3
VIGIKVWIYRGEIFDKQAHTARSGTEARNRR